MASENIDHLRPIPAGELIAKWDAARAELLDHFNNVISPKYGGDRDDPMTEQEFAELFDQRVNVTDQ